MLAWYIEDEWAAYDEALHKRNADYTHECSWWLRGFDEDACVYKADFSDVYFQPKPSRDIRREKTRNYRRNAWRRQPADAAPK